MRSSLPHRPALAERILFGSPRLYRVKRFLIEEVIWGWLLCGVLRMERRALPDLSERFRARRVLVAACGVGSRATGPPIEGAARVVAFDVSPVFARACARARPDWSVYCGDVTRLPHADGEFEVSVLYSALHHVPVDASRVLAELARVTTGRIVLLEGVLPEDGFLRHALLAWYRLVDGGFRYYTKRELLDRAVGSGLRLEAGVDAGPIGHMWLAELVHAASLAGPATRAAAARTTREAG